MTATAAMIAKVRKNVNEPDDSNGYTDALITTYIENYPLIDPRGEEPFTWDTSSQPPTEDTNENWIATYDLAAASADIWEEKAAVVAQDFNMDADGGRYDRNQVRENYMKQARYYRSKRSPSTITQEPWPREEGENIAFNVNDPIS
jgi:hypothetical protein